MALASNLSPSASSWPWRRRGAAGSPPVELTRETPGVRLADVLDAKLGQLRALGYRVLWIEAGKSDLITLFLEGGEDVVRLDPDSSRDLAWYGDVELRPSSKEFIWIYLEGEYPQVSAHLV